MATRIDTYTNDGLTFDVLDAGPVDGVPVVLLHGFPQTATSWDRLAPHLHDRGYRTIAPTQRGYSPGARPEGRRAYRVPNLVGDTVALVDAIGAGPVHLVGHDWGAIVAWAMAATEPSSVQTLTSVSVPHPMAFLRSMVRSTQPLKSCYMALFQLPRAAESALARPKFLARAMAQAGMDREQIARVRDEVVDTGALTYALNWYRALPFANPRAFRATVSVPTTHVWSTGDIALVRKGADLTADHVTGPYRLEVLEASHWIPEERPEDLAAIIAARADGTAESDG